MAIVGFLLISQSSTAQFGAQYRVWYRPGSDLFEGRGVVEKGVDWLFAHCCDLFVQEKGALAGGNKQLKHSWVDDQLIPPSLLY